MAAEGGRLFDGVVAVFVEGGVLRGRLEVWRRRVTQLGGLVLSSPCALSAARSSTLGPANHNKDVGGVGGRSGIGAGSKGGTGEGCGGGSVHVTHMFASDWKQFLARQKELNLQDLAAEGVPVVSFAWLEQCLRSNALVPLHPFLLSPPHHVSAAPATGSEEEDEHGEVEGEEDEGASTHVSPKGDGVPSQSNLMRSKSADGVQPNSLLASGGGVALGAEGAGGEARSVWTADGSLGYQGSRLGREGSAGADEEEAGEARAARSTDSERVLTKEEESLWLRIIHEGAKWGVIEKGLMVKRKREEQQQHPHHEEGSRGHARERAQPMSCDSSDDASPDLSQRVDESCGVGGGAVISSSSSGCDRGGHPDGGGGHGGGGHGGQYCGVERGGRASTHKTSSSSSMRTQMPRELRGFSPGCYDPPDLNRHITRPFSELRAIYKDALGDEWRSFNYYKAVSVLEKVPFRIVARDQAAGLPGFGSSLLTQVEEIIATGNVRRLVGFKKDPMVSTLTLFASIWGVGPRGARRLYDAGHRSLADLEGDPHALTPVQRTALKFHGDINRRIACRDVAEMEALVQREARAIQHGIEIVCGGSYRRGKQTVGDMDFVATHPDGRSHVGFLQKLVLRLKDIGFITEDLTIGYYHNHAALSHSALEGGGGSAKAKAEGRWEVSEGDDERKSGSRLWQQRSGSSCDDVEFDRDAIRRAEVVAKVDTFFGLCCKPGRQQRHRVDFKVYPANQYPFGLLAWTGNDVLNRRLRLLAESKGLRMDDHGLVPASAAQGSAKTRLAIPPFAPLPSEISSIRSEDDIFQFFGLPCLEPYQRNL